MFFNFSPQSDRSPRRPEERDKSSKRKSNLNRSQNEEPIQDSGKFEDQHRGVFMNADSKCGLAKIRKVKSVYAYWQNQEELLYFKQLIFESKQNSINNLNFSMVNEDRVFQVLL